MVCTLRIPLETTVEILKITPIFLLFLLTFRLVLVLKLKPATWNKEIAAKN